MYLLEYTYDFKENNTLKKSIRLQKKLETTFRFFLFIMGKSRVKFLCQYEFTYMQNFLKFK